MFSNMKLFISMVWVMLGVLAISLIGILLRMIYSEPWFIIATLIVQFIFCGIWGWKAADIIQRFRLY